MNRSHLLSLAYLAFGVVYFGIGIVNVQGGEMVVSSPVANLGTLLLFIGSIGMVAVAVGTFVHPEWMSQQSISSIHLIVIWACVLLGAAGFILELVPAIQ